MKLSSQWGHFLAAVAPFLPAQQVLVGADLVNDPTESILISEVGRLNNESLFWGPYKPNLYFGVRPRVPKGLWSGLMWVNVDTYENLNTGELASFCTQPVSRGPRFEFF